MKSVWFVEKGTAKLLEEEMPKCGKDTMLVKTKYSAMSNGTERGFLVGGPYNDAWPSRIGYCNVSEVVEVGEDIQNFKVGDVVFDATFSGHTEYHLVKEDQLVIKIPKGLDEKEATLLGVAGVAFYNAKLSNVTANDKVLVVGAGLIGYFACQVALTLGAEVYLADPNKERRELLEKCGVYATFDPTTEDGWNDLVNAGLYSVVMECSGADNLSQIMGTKPKSGVICDHGTLNLIAGRYEVYYKFRAAASRYMSIIHSNHFDMETLLKISKLAAKGRLDLQSAIKHTVSIDEAPKMYELLRDNPSQLMGVIFDWTKKDDK